VLASASRIRSVPTSPGNITRFARAAAQSMRFQLLILLYGTGTCGRRQAHDWGLPADRRILESRAGQYADMPTLDMMTVLGVIWSARAVAGAAKRALPTVLKWLCEEHSCKLSDELAETAAAARSIAVLRWLKQQGCVPFSSNTSNSAAAVPNNLPVLQYLLEAGCPLHEDVCISAAEANDFEQLRWLHAHGAQLSTSVALSIAHSYASSGAVHVFEWVQQQQQQQGSVAFDCHTMYIAADHNQLSLCKWLHAAGCPWDESCCMAAVDSQHTEMIRWLRSAGCPWDVEHICYFAVRTSTAHSQSVLMLQCLQELGALSTAADLTRALNHTGAGSNVLAANWLRGQGSAVAARAAQ
jgi:hypothetical protein